MPTDPTPDRPHDPANESPAIRCRLARPRVLTREELRTLDKTAVDELGLPSVLLMENAAIGAADAIIERAPGTPAPRVLIIAGGGNNGGDGLALARQLHVRGVPAAVLLFAEHDRLTPDTAANLRALRKTEIPIRHESLSNAPDPESSIRFAIGDLDATVVVDALFGTGLTRPVEGPLAGVVEAINAPRAGSIVPSVVTLDLPSGLDTDTGRPLGVAVRADLTVTFAALKTGFFALEAQPHLGEIVLVPIGVPPELTERFGELYEPDATRHARRDPSAQTPATPASNTPGRNEPDAHGPAHRPR